MDPRIHQVAGEYALKNPTVVKPKNTQTLQFKDILSEQNQKLKISKHASERLNERNIHIDEHQWQQIEAKMREAKKKGITDSLVVMNDAALLVSAKNNTVVTAMDRKEATSRIFTNINGTILMND
ncbi:TIGR02530 family flagellar biosynthesis protein [Oceanobacillus bengalensis]|uniref:Flagellar protein n=1 Tax=Oceanobacillus bengalensis TaxID=1435466 RepID=A0A494Z4D7_9BACI|nr:TIGR02530 family flagellar biosynthesis protein [Oceanobacillus bengalensis]RKQ17367.1 flagellar protein [Oceanobacillus bengalensis]